jgi:murein DD-endopeptidase MepM/ murein hydrolase activator NlpD
MMNHKFIIYLIFFGLNFSSAQTYYFPLGDYSAGDNYSTDNFSSPFGPRNKSKDEKNYPAATYDYDFHAGIDIHATNGTNVYPVCDGVVSNWGGDWIDIKHTDSQLNVFLVRYMHVDIAESFKHKNKSVVGGTDIIAEVADYLSDNKTGNDHLDIRLTWENTWGDNITYFNTDNP